MMVRLSVMFFLIGMSPGFYVPVLTNILLRAGLDSSELQWAWLAFPLASMISPLWIGALADNRFSAQRLLGWAGLISALLLGAGFLALDAGLSPWWFLILFFASSVIGASMWSTLAVICMRHLRHSERDFPVVRLGGTLGWLAAGYVTSLVLNADASPVAGYAAAIVRFLGGLLAFTLPDTPPPGRSRSWRTLMGFDAFRLLRERDHLVFFVTTALLSMPLVAFYMWLPRHLEETGDPQVAATMAMGQWSEIAAMLLMAALMSRFRVKTLLLTALGLSVLRYALFAWSGYSGERTGLLTGIALHGLCYTLYFITAQLFLDRRVAPELRGQAQGLLSLVSNGIGSLLGTILVRVWYDRTAADDGGGWLSYWGWLGASIAVLTLGFAWFYRGVPAARSKDPSA